MTLRSKLSVVCAVGIATSSAMACTSLLGDFAIKDTASDASDIDVTPPTEAGEKETDAGPDAARKSTPKRPDAGSDSRADAAPDALLDAGSDADACTTANCVSSVTANGHHTCATMWDGTLRCWGSNFFGESGPNGDGTRTPQLVTGIGPVRLARAGIFFTCALLVDGSVWCWGDNARGSLGSADASRFSPDGSVFSSATPVEVVGPGTASTLATGGYHACLTTVATPTQVLCWGDNLNGQAGVVDAAAVPVPVAVPVTNVVRLGLGTLETCIQRSVAPFGECLGDNAYGELGRGLGGDSSIDSVPHPTPDAVALGNWGALSEFVHSTGYQMAVVLQSGQVATWGADDLGQLGLLDDSGASQPTPMLVPSLNQVTGFTFMQSAACALRADGTVWCWGSTAYGETGTNASSGAVQYAPVQIPGLTGVTQITAGYNHVCAVLAGGGVDCWGWNADGELGRPTSAAFDPTPMPVQF
jgi:alpha-tubulin suppressor-like RCC1 family protein